MPLFALLAGCGESKPVTRDFFVRPHLVPNCEPPGEATITLAALGPFPPSNLTVENVPLYRARRELRFPADTAAVEAVATDGARRYLGYTERRRDGGFELSLLPERRECVLFGATDGGFPRDGLAKALGFSATAGVLFAAGGSNEAELSPGALAFDLDRASVHRIPDPEAEPCATCGLHTPRAHASVTDFGGALLVAGGELPEGGLEGEPGSSAEVYDPALGAFEPETIALQFGRTRHGALVLRGGETLLVGGAGESEHPLRLEVVSPQLRRSAYLGLAALASAREHPQVVRLSDDRVFVAGGVDESGAPVALAEWFSADAREAEGTRVLEAAYDWSFVALPGGGVLGVAGCDPAREPEACTNDCCDANCCRARCGPARGCPSDAAVWLDRDRNVTRLSAPASFSAPLLAAGSDGAPWLIDAGLPSAPVYRFDPWRGEFVRTTATLSTPPGRSRPDAGGDAFGAQPPLISLGPDAFAWFSGESPPSLLAFRGGTRGAFSNDVPLVVLADPDDPTRPAHLAPDRAAGEIFGRNEASLQNELLLEANEDAPRVWLTDARFGDASVRVDFSDSPPRVLLGAMEIGSDACPWPLPDETGGTLRVTRRGADLVLTQGRASVRCDGPVGDVSLGLRAGARTSRVSQFEVVRD